MKKTLEGWIDELKSQFDERTLKYQSVHKAIIQLQMKDEETGNIELHNFEYHAKDAANLKVEYTSV